MIENIDPFDELNLFQTFFNQANMNRPQKSCPHCGMTLQAYRLNKTLVCPACYTAFAQELQTKFYYSQRGARYSDRKNGEASAYAKLIREACQQGKLQALTDIQNCHCYLGEEEIASLRERLQKYELRSPNKVETSLSFDTNFAGKESGRKLKDKIDAYLALKNYLEQEQQESLTNLDNLKKAIQEAVANDKFILAKEYRDEKNKEEAKLAEINSALDLKGGTREHE